MAPSFTLDLPSAAYLLFRLLPFLTAAILTLAPALIFSWKGLPYLLLLLLTLTICSATAPFLASVAEAQLPVGRLPSASNVCSSFLLGGGGQAPFSVAAPLDVALMLFTTMYLAHPIHYNGLSQIYLWLAVVFPLVSVGYIAFLASNGCSSWLRIALAAVIGGAGGWISAAFVARFFPGLQYLSAPSSRQSCTRISDTVFTCRSSDSNPVA